MASDRIREPDHGHTEDLDAFFDEAARTVRGSGVLGRRGRLQELFDYLAEHRHDAHPPKESELAAEVFNKTDLLIGGDDPIVRVSVHRLRKALAEYYAEHPSSAVRLAIPKGEYRIVIQPPADEQPGQQSPDATGRKAINWAIYMSILALTLAAIAGFLLYEQKSQAVGQNAAWHRLRESSRPLVILVNDEFLLEKDGNRPDNGASPLPDGHGTPPVQEKSLDHRDMSYLPLSVAYALKDIAPQLVVPNRPLELIPISQTNSGILPNLLKEKNVVYIGNLRGLEHLQLPIFVTTRYIPNASYDGFTDARTRRKFTSGEDSIDLNEKRIYKDFGYISVQGSPDGKMIGIVAGTGNMGLRAAAEIASARKLPGNLARIAKTNDDYEVLIESRGQSYTNVSNQIISADKLPYR